MKQSQHKMAPETKEEIEKIKVMYDTHIKAEEIEFQKLYEMINGIKTNLDLIFPSAKQDMENAVFWEHFRSKLKNGGGAILWLVGVIAGLIILAGHFKVAFLSFLFSK